ncbi:MAG: 3-ketoacyl-ACP reductase, partial [Bacteroidetes bacterium]|nr:3-ketoacyl-ACP reductase [Bacteroidota bacterium]
MNKPIPVILITGASRGLGRGIAIEVAKCGYSAVINYANDRKSALETASLCDSNRISKEQNFIPIQADIGESAHVRRLVKKTL